MPFDKNKEDRKLGREEGQGKTDAARYLRQNMDPEDYSAESTMQTLAFERYIALESEGLDPHFGTDATKNARRKGRSDAQKGEASSEYDPTDPESIAYRMGVEEARRLRETED